MSNTFALIQEPAPTSTDSSKQASSYSHAVALPIWSWAEFIGWGLAGIFAGLIGIAILKFNKGGPFHRDNRMELIAAVIMGFVAGIGGVVLTWIFHAIGIR